MTVDEVKIWINRAHKIDELIRLDKKKLEELEELSTTIPSIQTSEKVQTSKNLEPPYIGDLIKKDEVRRKLNHRIVERYNIKNEIDKVINAIRDNEIIQVLDYRYLQFLKFRDIASLMYMGLGSVHRLHNKGLLEVKKILEQMEQEGVL